MRAFRLPIAKHPLKRPAKSLRGTRMGAALRAVGLASLMGGASLAWGQSTQANGVWQWRGPDGKIVVSDRPPPPSVSDRQIIKRPYAPRATTYGTPVADASAAPSPGAAATEQGATPGDAAPPAASAAARDAALDAREAKLQAAAAAASAARAAQAAAKAASTAQAQQSAKQERCKQAMNRLALLQSGQRLRKLDSPDAAEYMNDAERAQATQRAQAEVNANCH